MPHPIVLYLRKRFAPLANPDHARAMAAYMKTDMPFFGIKVPVWRPIMREAVRLHPLATRREYVQAIEALWHEPQREMKHSALHIARASPQFITMASLPLYRRLIVEGGWWDFVDTLAIHLVGRVVLNERDRAAPVMRKWIDDERHMWLRRSAIICQVAHKRQTDAAMLMDFCLRRAHEKEFFIRKAIGWSLRQYAYVNRRAVKSFLRQHGKRLSGLSGREAAKHLGNLNRK